MPSRSSAKTKSAPKLVWLLLVAFIACLAVAMIGRNNSVDKTVIRVGKSELITEIADTPSEHRQGLSGRENLEKNRAMLFVFEQTGFHGFWMKDMKFSLDIVWLNDDKEIIKIIKSLAPNSYPKVYKPEQASRYVLEMPAGSADDLGIRVGQTIDW